MKKEELLNILEEIYLNAGYKEEDIILVRPYFNDLSKNIIEKLLKLEINEFSEYFNFIKKFIIAKNGVYGYVDILEYITSHITKEFYGKKTRFLMNLLVETDIISNPDIKNFAYLFMEEFDSNKIDIIRKILHAYKYKTSKLDISSLLITINELDEVSCEFLNDFLQNSELKNDNNFLKYLDLLINNIKHENVDLFLNVLGNANFRKNKNALEIAKRFIFAPKPDFEKSKLINFMLTNEYFLKNKYLIKMLTDIDSIPVGLYPYVKGLIKSSNEVSEEVFYTLYDGLLKTKTKAQGYSILNLAYYKKLHTNTISLAYFISRLIEMKGESLKELDKYLSNLEDNSNISNINIHSKVFSLVIDSLIKASEAYQAKAIIKFSKYFNNINSNYIVKFILESQNEKDCIYLYKLLEKTDILNNSKFEIVLNNINKISNDNSLNLVIKLCSESKYLELENFNYILNIILRLDVFKLEYVTEFLDKVLESQNRDLILSYNKENGNIIGKLLKLYTGNLNDSQHLAILALLDNKAILENTVNLDYMIEIIYKTKQDFKLDSILKYAYSSDLNNSLLEEDKNDFIIKNIINSSKNYQAMCLVLVSKYINDSDKKDFVVSAILQSKSAVLCNYIYSFVSIPNILENGAFTKALKEMSVAKYDFQIKGIMEASQIFLVSRSEAASAVFKLINNCKKAKQVEVILNVLRNCPVFLEELEFNLLLSIIETKNDNKLMLLQEILLSYNDLGYTQTKELIYKVLNYNKSDFKEKYGNMKFEDVVNEVIECISVFRYVPEELYQIGKNEEKILRLFK